MQLNNPNQAAEMVLAFCMGMHDRLGSDSVVRNANPDICKIIGSAILTESVQMEAAEKHLPQLFAKIPNNKEAMLLAGKMILENRIMARCLSEDEFNSLQNASNQDEIQFVPVQDAVAQVRETFRSCCHDRHADDDCIHEQAFWGDDNEEQQQLENIQLLSVRETEELTMYLQFQNVKLPVGSNSCDCSFCYDIPEEYIEDHMEMYAAANGYNYRAHIFSSSLHPDMFLKDHCKDVVSHIRQCSSDESLAAWLAEAFVIEACMFLDDGVHATLSRDIPVMMMREMDDLYLTIISFNIDRLVVRNEVHQCDFMMDVRVFMGGSAVQIKYIHHDVILKRV